MRRTDPAHTLLLLGLLRQQRMHGYRLHEFIDRDLASCTDLKRPTAYLLLDRLAERGWVTVRVRRAGRRPPRREYSLTPSGETAFQQLLRENLESFSPVRFADDIGVAFLDAIDPADARAHLLRRRATVRQTLAHVRGVAAHDGHRGSSQLVIAHLAHHLASEARWLDILIRKAGHVHDDSDAPLLAPVAGAARRRRGDAGRGRG